MENIKKNKILITANIFERYILSIAPFVIINLVIIIFKFKSIEISSHLIMIFFIVFFFTLISQILFRDLIIVSESEKIEVRWFGKKRGEYLISSITKYYFFNVGIYFGIVKIDGNVIFYLPCSKAKGYGQRFHNIRDLISEYEKGNLKETPNSAFQL